MQTVGIIGLGLLGSALAQRLLAQGYSVVGFDVAADRRQALSAAGGKPVDSAPDVARGAQIILLSLPNSRIVAEVIEQIEGDLVPGCVVIDTTTGDPDDAIALAARLRERQVRLVEATVAGSSVQARAGQAIIMAGGEAVDVEAVDDLLRALAVEVFHVGPCGNGARMKLALNLVLGLHRAVLAEGLALAKAMGLDPAATLEILRASPAYSRVMDTKGDKMLAGDFTPQARLSQHLKDVRLILAAAERTGAWLPLSLTHRQLLERAETAGWGELDNSVIARVFALGQPPETPDDDRSQ